MYGDHRPASNLDPALLRALPFPYLSTDFFLYATSTVPPFACRLAMTEPSALKPSQWRGSIRWFAAELLVVVAGILIALALQAWWNTRSDREREERYLLQLRADLLQTELSVRTADSVMAPRDAEGARALRAFYQPEPPPTDSLVYWAYHSLWYELPRPVLGTVEALVTTGDLGLIQSDSLRSAITNYLDQNRTAIEEYAAYLKDWTEAGNALGRFLKSGEYRELLPRARVDSVAAADPLYPVPPSPRRRPFPFRRDEFLRNGAAFDALESMNIDKQNMRDIRKVMLDTAVALREQVDRALAR